MLVEVQLFQVVLQGGLLGLLVYLVFWYTRSYVPFMATERQQDRREQAERRNEQVVQREAVQAAYAAQAKQQRDDYLSSLQEIEARHAAEAEECRKERREQGKQAQMEREADRLARHELSTMIQKVIGELHDALPNRTRVPNDHR